MPHACAGFLRLRGSHYPPSRFPIAAARVTIASHPLPALAMTHPDREFDPDDNFANSFDPGVDADEEDTPEALVWQLLLLINPGDEESALQQFSGVPRCAGRGRG